MLRTLLALLFALGIVTTASSEVAATDPAPAADAENTMLQFGELASSFRPLDDRVMGGVSRSRLDVNDAGNGVFQGTMSLDNNGGFASVRATGLELDLSSYERVVLRVRGDGQRYKLRLHDDARYDGIAFQMVFDTIAGEWIDVELPLDAFEPVWRGRRVVGAPPLERSRITMLGVMISDGQEGEFHLELESLSGR